MAKVTIIVPIYNAEKYLEECLESVINQSYRNLEVILINDGSEDKSVEIATSFAERDDRFKLLMQSNHGLGYTRNRGVKESSGKYIFFLDSDDVIPKKAIEALVTKAEKSEADIAVGKVLRKNQQRSYIPVRHLEFNLYAKPEVTNVHSQKHLVQDSIVCNKLWKTSFVKEHNLLFLEGKYYEDLLFSLQGQVLATRIAIINETVYYWRLREDTEELSITQEQMKLQNTLDRLEVLKLCHNWLKTENIDGLIQREYELKGCLDVIRLHAEKYSLVHKEDRDVWFEEVSNYLLNLQETVVTKLSGKERLFAAAIFKNSPEDLLLLSTVKNNLENKQIVYEADHTLYVDGVQQRYSLKGVFKPEAIIEAVNVNHDELMLSIKVMNPKMIKPFTASLVGTSRQGKSRIRIANFNCNKANDMLIYPYSLQEVNVSLSIQSLHQSFEGLIGEYDLFIEIESKRSARLRYFDLENKKIKVSTSNREFQIYRTNRGNATITIREKTVYYRFRKLMAKIIKR
ncbi:glycosyltransferase family 2 protein [Jeotgalibacillus proteolyticus]|uniref:Glycosyltransferase 2-like domain-containing protein n=1 Tax=Jeotgalibacillus proteolyticus TaxID=2082395 RepID=A0A2S5GBJ5_9BACL|nr:glycosyltransferase family 2 protein [Jeotgalibacillus proteolyticus]PPA70284.1 hypothetical protein C4B60_11945 [Jeotgalibacillus proteolyticus]